MDDGGRIIIVKKKSRKKGGHHGGSWKVAYADFVTAMMAFFLVMWIVGMDSDVKDLVEGYFNNPIGFRRAYGSGMSPMSQGSTPLATELTRMPLFVRQVEERRFNAVRDEILRELDTVAGGAEGLGSQIEVVVTPDGLRIELREGVNGETFFTFGSDAVKPAAIEALRVLLYWLSRRTSASGTSGTPSSTTVSVGSGSSSAAGSSPPASSSRHISTGSGPASSAPPQPRPNRRTSHGSARVRMAQ